MKNSEDTLATFDVDLSDIKPAPRGWARRLVQQPAESSRDMPGLGFNQTAFTASTT